MENTEYIEVFVEATIQIFHDRAITDNCDKNDDVLEDY